MDTIDDYSLLRTSDKNDEIRSSGNDDVTFQLESQTFENITLDATENPDKKTSITAKRKTLNESNDNESAIIRKKVSLTSQNKISTKRIIYYQYQNVQNANPVFNRTIQ